MEMENDKGCFHVVSFTDQDGQFQTSKIPVVQELVRQGLHNQPLHRFQSQQSLSSSELQESETPPSINLTNLNSDSNHPTEIRTLELTKLAKAARDWGLFLLVDHGISSEVLESLEETVKGFFDLSFEEKKKSVGTCFSSVDNMGYGRNFVKSQDQPLDWIDRLTMRAAPKLGLDDGSEQGVQVWPQNPANFREIMEKYVEEVRRVLDQLLRALAEALGLDAMSFIQNFEPNESVMNVRVNYYPPCPRPELTLGLTPHTDASALTLLTQFGATEGLQVYKDAKWFTITWPSNGLLVNVGDLLEIMSGGRVRSPWHRATTRKDKERYSVAVFYNPSPVTEIEPVTNDSSSGSRYKKVVVQEYLEHLYKISPTDEKKAILFAIE